MHSSLRTALIFVSLTTAFVFTPPSANAGTRTEAVQASGATQVKPWDTPEWKACFAKFKRTAKPAKYPRIQRLINGECLSDKQVTRLPGEICFMEAVSPSDLLSATDFEVKFVCIRKDTWGLRAEMVCTNKKSHYMEQMTSQLPNDSRCTGFPNLLAVDMRKKGPNRAIQDLSRNRQPSSVDCEIQGDVIQRLENHPRFDSDRTIRQAWSEQVAIGSRMGCSF